MEYKQALGYKKSVIGQAGTSGPFKSPVNLKALTTTSSVPPNIFWHSSEKTGFAGNTYFTTARLSVMICNSHYWHFDITCKPSFYAFPLHLTCSWIFQKTLFLVAQRLKRLPAMRETWVRSLGWEDPLEKEMATHSSILAWRIPWTEEIGGLQSTGLKETERLHFHFSSIFLRLCHRTWWKRF